MEQSNKKDSLRGWLSWIIVAFFFFVDYCLKNSIGALGPELIHKYHMTQSQLIDITAAFPAAYLFLQIPAGVLVDRYGPRRVITLASMICAFGCYLFSHVESYYCLVIGRAMIGIGAAFSLVTCSKIASIWFCPRRFAFLFGLMIMIAFSGAFIGMRAVMPAIDFFGWEKAMLIAALLCFTLAILMALIIRDTNDGSEYKLESCQSMSMLLKEILIVMTSRRSWMLALFAGLMFVPTTVIANWGPQFFTGKYLLSGYKAAQVTSWLFIGWIVGSPLSGYISDYLGKRTPVMFASAGATLLLSLILILPSTLDNTLLMLCVFGLGVTSSGFALSFTVLKESYSKDLVGAAMGFMNTMNTLFETLSTIIAGHAVSLAIILQASDPKQASFFIIPVCLLLALIIAARLRESSSQK